MSRLSKEFKAGFIFLLSIVLLVYGLKYLKGLNVFQADKPYFAVYSDVDGLQVGSSVTLNGFKVGVVSDMYLIDNNKILATLNINRFDSIKNNKR